MKIFLKSLDYWARASGKTLENVIVATSFAVAIKIPRIKSQIGIEEVQRKVYESRKIFIKHKGIYEDELAEIDSKQKKEDEATRALQILKKKFEDATRKKKKDLIIYEANLIKQRLDSTKIELSKELQKYDIAKVRIEKFETIYRANQAALDKQKKYVAELEGRKADTQVKTEIPALDKAEMEAVKGISESFDIVNVAFQAMEEDIKKQELDAEAAQMEVDELSASSGVDTDDLIASILAEEEGEKKDDNPFFGIK